MRTININITPGEMKDISNATDPVELKEALGYLATWGLHTTDYDTVNIWATAQESNPSLYAVYVCKDNPDERFRNDADWREDWRKFTFHFHY